MRITNDILKETVKNSVSYNQVFEKLNVIGGEHKKHTSKRIENLNLDTSHFRGQNWNKGLKKITNGEVSWGKYTKDQVFCKNSVVGGKVIKNWLLGIRPYHCEDCGLSEWKNQKIVLEVDHIDGDNRNNLEENLRLLCPNCHSCTPTWRGRNVNLGVIKVSDKNLLEALNKYDTIRQALIAVGLSPRGGNYKRAKRLLRI